MIEIRGQQGQQAKYNQTQEEENNFFPKGNFYSSFPDGHKVVMAVQNNLSKDKIGMGIVDPEGF